MAPIEGEGNGHDATRPSRQAESTLPRRQDLSGCGRGEQAQL